MSSRTLALAAIAAGLGLVLALVVLAGPGPQRAGRDRPARAGGASASQPAPTERRVGAPAARGSGARAAGRPSLTDDDPAQVLARARSLELGAESGRSREGWQTLTAPGAPHPQRGTLDEVLAGYRAALEVLEVASQAEDALSRAERRALYERARIALSALSEHVDPRDPAQLEVLERAYQQTREHLMVLELDSPRELDPAPRRRR